ncbi:MAG: hypothetical protein EXR69_10565 [Myxococcales bacterium]|nr:hypothetical protein [Myxococcales bacterium]
MFMLIFAFLGCTSAEGVWEGTCSGSGYPVDTVLDISDDKGGDLDGNFTITSSGYSVSGLASGSRDGSSIDLDIPLVGSGMSIATTFDGEMDGNDMTGYWIISQSGYTMTYTCDLSRD